MFLPGSATRKMMHSKEKVILEEIFLFSERDPCHPGPQMKLPQAGPVDELCVGMAQRPLPMVCPGDVCQEPDARSWP